MQNSGIQHSNVEEHARPRHREEKGQSIIGAPAWRSSSRSVRRSRNHEKVVPLAANTPAQVKARRCRVHVHPVKRAGEAWKMAGGSS
jgi:hypothetical protein